VTLLGQVLIAASVLAVGVVYGTDVFSAIVLRPALALVDIADGRVSYANRYLDTPARRADADGKMEYSEFATDPCRSLFKRFTQAFTGPMFGANANVTIGPIAEQFVAETEYPMLVAFDLETLDTIGVVSLDDRLKGAVTPPIRTTTRMSQQRTTIFSASGPRPPTASTGCPTAPGRASCSAEPPRSGRRACTASPSASGTSS
jgi:hypothetical protein